MEKVKCVGYAHKILMGLEMLHRNNLIHRDLKPSNVIMDGDSLKLTDFGVAKYISDGQSLEQSCTGTP